MKISKKLIIAFKVILTFFLILFLFKRVNMSEVIYLMKQLELKYLFSAIIFYFLILMVAAYRWQCLLGIQNIKLSLGKLIRLTFIGYFFNNFLPTTVGGDVVKGYLVAKETKKTAESYVAVLMDRVMGIVGLLVVALLVVLFLPSIDINRSIIYLIWGAFIFFILIIIISTFWGKYFGKKMFFLKRILQKLKIDDKLKKIYDVFYVHNQHKGILIKTILLSLIIQTCFISNNYFIVKSLPLPQTIPLIYFFIYTPTIALISSLPITINGIGVRENLYVEFFSRFLGREAAGSLSIILLFFLLGSGLIGGVFYLFSDFKIVSISTLTKKEIKL